MNRHADPWLVLAALPVMYVLLLGPAARYHGVCPPVIQEGLEALYAPLEWLDQKTPGRPFSKYVELWEN